MICRFVGSSDRHPFSIPRAGLARLFHYLSWRARYAYALFSIAKMATRYSQPQTAQSSGEL